MDIKKHIDPADFEVGVIIGRFQTNKLHEGHINLISHVLSNHKKTIILLGVSRVQNTKKNPLDFASRKAMIQKLFPSVMILPIMDQRYDEAWSSSVDNAISMPFGEKKAVIYGSRDSFIPHYKGKYSVIELEASFDHNATNIRTEVARETLDSSDFRAGVIYSAFNQRPVTYPTVDICAFNQKGEILMARKPNEKYWRFVGGFVDPTDASFEQAALREFREETGGSCVIGNLKYIASHRVADWRYAKEESGIMTTLYLGEYNMGMAKASDDIAEVKWVPINEFSNFDGVRTKVMPEHRELMTTLVNRVYSENLIPNIGERLAERTDNITYTAE
jgi:bifunctional NMN adenylyltransferase/nudix hydrolase